MKFADLALAGPILRAVANEGYETATPIQAQAIPPILEGRDMLGCAQTGTGKTAAFALPILHRLTTHAVPQGAARRMRALILCPTRELASQIQDSFRAYGAGLPLRHTVIFGGVGQGPQVTALRNGVEIVVATPGRFLDLMQQGHVNLSGIQTLVLDEADRMLDMGFINDIRKIVAKLPQNRQTLLFSATMPPEIRALAQSILRNPATVQIAAVSQTADRISESVYFVEKRNKPALLAHLVRELPMYRTIVFTRTKHGADRVVRQLHQRGIKSEAIHGNKAQNARKRALANFTDNKIPVLVATDIASRGIDVDGITHVVNYDLTHEPETYVHRIGRTARAGASGTAVSFCDRDERANLKAIERLIRRTIKVETNLPTFEDEPRAAAEQHGPAPHHSGARVHPKPAMHAPKPQRHAPHGPAAAKPQRATGQHAPQGNNRGGSNRRQGQGTRRSDGIGEAPRPFIDGNARRNAHSRPRSSGRRRAF